MKLLGLEPLYRSMISQNFDRQKFRYKHGRVTFDVFFFIDTRPFELLFGCLGGKFAFTVEVRLGFIIDPYLGDDYGRLCEVLGLIYDPNNPFSTAAFFRDFERYIPMVATRAGVPLPHEVAIYRRDVKDADKIFFCGWRNNIARGENVTEENLHKTFKILGQRAHDSCKRRNTSSCWTDAEKRAIEMEIP